MIPEAVANPYEQRESLTRSNGVPTPQGYRRPRALWYAEDERCLREFLGGGPSWRSPFRWHASGKDPAAVGKLMERAQPSADAGKLVELEKLADQTLDLLGETEEVPEVYRKK